MKIPANILKARKIEKEFFELENGMSLTRFNEMVDENCSDWFLSDLYFDRTHGYDMSDTWTLMGSRLETKEEVQAHVDEWVRVYTERMAEINATAAKKLAQRNDKDWKEFQRLKRKFSI